MRKGSVGVWSEISPYLGGVGIASVVVCFLVSLYYNVIIAWCFFYFFKSFQNPLPWSECPLEPVTLGNITTMEPVHECNVTTPTEYFWYRTTLQISTSIEDSGGINWKLCACLVGTWILIWLCMMKGTKITGKVKIVLSHDKPQPTQGRSQYEANRGTCLSHRFFLFFFFGESKIFLKEN